MIEELLLMVENLEGITSTIVSSDHIINLLPEADGRLPDDKQKIISVLKGYLELPENEKIIYRIGRRTGVMSSIKDLDDGDSRDHVLGLINKYGINSDNVDAFVDDLVNRFI
jgi:hypothetical protein